MAVALPFQVAFFVPVFVTLEKPTPGLKCKSRTITFPGPSINLRARDGPESTVAVRFRVCPEASLVDANGLMSSGGAETPPLEYVAMLPDKETVMSPVAVPSKDIT